MWLVRTFLSARNKVERIEEDLKQAKDELNVAKTALVNSKEFTEKSITVDWNTITKRETKTTKLKAWSVIPDAYITEIFDYNAMIKWEPKQRERLVKQYMIDYPEYKVKKLDEERAMKEMPELFEEVVTTTLVLNKAQEKVNTSVPSPNESVTVRHWTSRNDDDLPF